MPFIKRVKRQKGRKTEKLTANVQMARTVGVVFGLSVLFTSETKETTLKEPPPLTQRQADILRSRCLLSDYPQVILQVVLQSVSKTLLLSDLAQCFLTDAQRSQLRFYPSEFPSRELVLEISGFFQNHLEVLLADLLLTPVYELL